MWYFQGFDSIQPHMHPLEIMVYTYFGHRKGGVEYFSGGILDPLINIFLPPQAPLQSPVLKPFGSEKETAPSASPHGEKHGTTWISLDHLGGQHEHFRGTWWDLLTFLDDHFAQIHLASGRRPWGGIPHFHFDPKIDQNMGDAWRNTDWSAVSIHRKMDKCRGTD